jgi:hypothetical protein
MKSPPIESPIRRWREEAGLTQTQLALVTGVSSTTIVWNELLLYPEPSTRIVSVFQYGSRVPPYSPPVGPLGSYQNYVNEYNLAQREHRKLTHWQSGSTDNFLDNIAKRKWFRNTIGEESIGEKTSEPSVSSSKSAETITETLRGRTYEARSQKESEDRRQEAFSTSKNRQNEDENGDDTTYIRSNPSPNIRDTIALHPFEEWRISLGYPERVSFCRAACLSPPQVLNYERARQRSMPKSVRLALSQVLEINFLDRLEYYGALYYRYKSR